MALRLLMTTDAVGGVWTYATDLAAGLAAQGVRTTLAVLGPPPDRARADIVARHPGISLIETGLPLDWLGDEPGTRGAARELADLARGLGAGVIQLNSPALAAAADWSAPVIGVAHGCPASWWEAVHPGTPLPDDLAWHAALMHDGLAACSRVVAPSAAYAAQLTALYRLRAPPVVVPNGRSCPAPAAPAPLEAPAPPEGFAFTAGRLWDEAKQTALLDQVAARIAPPFLAAGAVRGPHGQGVAPAHLRLCGELSPAALQARLAGRPVFVSAARFEPFGLAVLEAAASGCALVLSDIPVFRELWTGAARFVPGDDAAGFARAITALLDDPAERHQAGEQARRRAARYAIAPMAAAMAGLYRDGLARGAARRAVPA